MFLMGFEITCLAGTLRKLHFARQAKCSLRSVKARHVVSKPIKYKLLFSTADVYTQH